MDNQIDRPRCIRCGVPAYGSVVFAPLCPFCQHSDDVAEAETEKKRHAAEMAAQEFSNEWAEAALPPSPPLWERPMMFTPTDGSDITPITGSAEGDALMYGEDDSPEVEYIPFEDDGGEWDS